MESEYDRKFAEMKQYIPFLERMITRLENASLTSGKPRQAQLDKIKSLKHLLLNKQKRMKMKNLLKCEQVLLNLYQKVEQKDCVPLETSTTTKAISDLETARNKLMSKKKSSEKVPEIAKGDNIEAVCSRIKTPALFQRRPNRCSGSHSVSPSKSAESTNSNRNYTRVLASPEPSGREGWSAVRADAENVLYSRRSPRRSPLRRSSSYNKKEKKKSSRRSKSRSRRNLNITLKVPEESLFSLNTEDILPRIINCNSEDVDIDALRNMRSQILAELKQTGLNEDISDLILKSYKKKKDKKKVATKSEEVEEGELSDSESEAIESIYNSVIILDNDKKKDKTQKIDNATDDKDKQPRKIQICLVINSDKENNTIENKKKTVSDFSELEMYNDIISEDAIATDTSKKSETPRVKKNMTDEKVDVNNTIHLEDNKNKEVFMTKNELGIELLQNESEESRQSNVNNKVEGIQTNSQNVDSNMLKQSELEQENNNGKALTFSPNFYKQLSENTTTVLCSDNPDITKNKDIEIIPDTENIQHIQSNSNKEMSLTEPQKLDVEPPKNNSQESDDIPFLNNEQFPPLTEQKKENVPSQIDILLALTDQLLSDSNVLPGTETVNATQSSVYVPKITKVTSATENITKKRISIEKYKEKATSSPKHKQSLSESDFFSKEDNFKKQSIKLTLKECERFSFINKFGSDYSSDEEDSKGCNITSVDSIDEIYDNLAPKSPDTLPSEDKTVPIIIPTDPVKTLNTTVPKNDVDMRCLPMLSPIHVGQTSHNINKSNTGDVREIQNTICNDNVRLTDPRIRKELDKQNNINENREIREAPFLNNKTPRVRSFEVSPRISDDHSNSLTNITSVIQKRDNRDNLNLDKRFDPWKQDLRDPRSGTNFVYSEINRTENRLEGPLTPSHYFGRSDCSTPTPSFGRLDPPPALLNPFGSMESPPTPNHPFGMADGPSSSVMNPVYGMSDSPSTPLNSFWSNDPPSTPNHPFGISDGSSTPSHSFGRSSHTQNQHFLSQKYSKPLLQDPRLNRHFEDSYCKKGEDYYKNRNTSNYRRHAESVNRTYNNPEVYRNYRRESIGSDRDDSSKDRWRESSTSRRMSKEYDSDRFNSRDRHYKYDSELRNNRSEDQHNFNVRNELHREQSVSRTYPENTFYRNNRASSIGRTSRDELPNDKLFVKSHAGRSFYIKTSVNTTFQQDPKENSFESRRQRASSVGRFSSSERSADKTQRSLPKHSDDRDKVKANSFQRAKSVGRDALELKSVKSFEDRKADFEAFKKFSRSYEEQLKNKDRSSRSKDFYGVQRKGVSDDYKCGTRKNSRSSRIRQDYKRDDKYKHIQHRGRNDSYNKQKYSLVYSSDNIAKGTIFGAGYGVKNYKIPKIKRPIEEITDKLDSKDENRKDSLKVKEHKPDISNKKTKDVEGCTVGDASKRKNDIKEKIESSKIDSDESESASTKTITNKENKCVVKNSNHENDQNTTKVKTYTCNEKSQIQEIDETKKPLIKSRKKCSIKDEEHKFDSDNLSLESSVTSVKEIENADIDVLEDSSDKFETKTLPNDKKNDEKLLKSLNSKGIDLDIFADNADPIVMSNNINDLIQHLEHDLDTSKPTHPAISATEAKIENSDSKGENVSLNIENVDLLTENIKISDKTEKSLEVQNENPCLLKSDILQMNSQDRSDENKISSNVSNTSEEINNVVTQVNLDMEQKINSDPIIINHESDITPVPDSTINTNENQILSGDNIVDKEKDGKGQNYMVDNITSTHNNIECSNDNAKLRSLKNQTDSLESLLSILQNKTKIKELLSKLGDQSNEKIKKKLEKLSEIVSDNEDDTVEVNKVESTTSGDENNDSADKANVPCNINEENLNIENSPEEKLNSEDAKNDNACSAVNNELDSQVQDNLTAENGIQNEQVEDPPNEKIPKRKKTGKYKKINSKKNKSQTLQKANSEDNTKVTKKLSRSTEVMKLQQDTKEMFVKGETPNTIGIRLCRLAKLEAKKEDSNKNDDFLSDEQASVKKQLRKKPGPKPKKKIHEKSTEDEAIKPSSETVNTSKYKPGPKSKTMLVKKSDPYAFECDSGSDINATKEIDIVGSDSDDDFMSSDVSVPLVSLVEPKVKQKRRRAGWKTGVIKTKGKKKKVDMKEKEEKSYLVEDTIPISQFKNPDDCCFTDKSYCFLKNVATYTCRLCGFRGADIVNHFKKNHPHSEIPLSRMNSEIAKEAIEQCDDPNFDLASKIPTEKYVCRFCFKEFSKQKNPLEKFFWHVVNKHTGEYKQLCPECVNVNQCPFNLDIPPPPKDNVKGQLIGFMCGKCYFTQLSLENLKSHVLVRHNDEDIMVFTINLASISKKKMMEMVKRAETPRVLRSSRSNQSLVEQTDERSSITESSDRTSETESEVVDTSSSVISPYPRRFNRLKFETDDITSNIRENNKNRISDIETETNDTVYTPIDRSQENIGSADIKDCAHFQIRLSSSGTKEYVCCINGINNHYTTGLLISMKKHIQTKHSEKWDGYCFICKVIVTEQGVHYFKECFQHFLDKHIDDFPVLTNENQIPIETEVLTETQTRTVQSSNDPESPKPQSVGFINVRPFSELISKPVDDHIEIDLPKIQSVVSLGSAVEDNFYNLNDSIEIRKETKYEEIQAAVMANKHSVVLQSMTKANKLVRIFKCAGRYCSFTTDFAEEALLHASRHQQIGGTDALNCAYCDFDSSGNAIDLVAHVFKEHGSCLYVCGKCFYRSVSSQLVAAHFFVRHRGFKISVLMSSLGTLPHTADDVPLTRKAAVSYFVCDQGLEDTNSCVFRTYISQKFVEHLSQRHCNDVSFKCFICKSTTNNTDELMKHLCSHNLNLYQCAFCVFGAPNEGELLAHAASKHPDRMPQAYIRIVTGKDGAEKFVPLAKIGKNSKIAVNTVTPCQIKENPTREAERSLDLEKLIGHIHIESLRPNVVVSREAEEELREVIELPIKIEPNTDPKEKSATVFTSPEPSPLKTTDSSLVICLDSDEEDSKDKITLLSLPDGPDNTVPKSLEISHTQDAPQVGGSLHATLPTSSSPIDAGPSTSLNSLPDATGNLANDDNFKRVTLYQLFKCPVCSKYYKHMERFRSHLNQCTKGHTKISCAHCNYTSDDRNDLCHHYLQHLLGDRYECGVCKYPFGKRNVAIRTVKRHMRQAHDVISVSVSITNEDKSRYILRPSDPEPSLRPKRSASSKTPEKKRYGPLDVDSLPPKPILDEEVFCTLCEFHTKVRHNMVRHLQLHAEQQPVPETAPINPVPHLQTNEKHFDKMVNLASSSLAPKLNDKFKADGVTLALVTPEAASCYPKFVDEKIRFSCGAIGCVYTSINEESLRSHWVTLHSNTTNYRCVHCPPNQCLDKSKPLTIGRILAHLKMHDSILYACSGCTYYHHKDNMINKHIAENHEGCRMLIVRGEGSSAGQHASAAPTMDLKPWQCGLCKFKSLLRPDVVEHCARVHQSKMQYKCFYCPYRTSAQENIVKHQATSHRDKPLETFYFFYREGSIPDQPDGTPRWLMQAKNYFPVKTEAGSVETPSVAVRNDPVMTVAVPTVIPTVDLNIVKKEVPEDSVELSVKELCEKFGSFGEPNGITFKCPMCNVVTEDTWQAMQSHLYEELNYRKWGCDICFYKAYHSKGLAEHAATEHVGQKVVPIALPGNINIETYVARILEHQERGIAAHKEKLAKQKLQPQKSAASTSAENTNKPNKATKVKTYSDSELIKAFGQFGSPNGDKFCCPKCKMVFESKPEMSNHLENELSQIRWYCNVCSEQFQTYHEAQFHCRSDHALGTAKPEGAIRDPSVREAWVESCLRIQQEQLTQHSYRPDSSADQSSDNTGEDSLLMVRYETDVPVPEAAIAQPQASPPHLVATKRSADDSDDEPLYIDEDSQRPKPKKPRTFDCKFCKFTTKALYSLQSHIYLHYNLKPFKCHYCEFMGHRKTVQTHLIKNHPTQLQIVDKTPIPKTPPTNIDKNKHVTRMEDEESKVVCLKCLNAFTVDESESHTHAGITPDFSKQGEVVMKCSICCDLLKNITAMSAHNDSCHSQEMSYTYYKIEASKKNDYECTYCSKQFENIHDMRLHHNAEHSAQEFVNQRVCGSRSEEISMEAQSVCSESLPGTRKSARKSTTKLPQDHPIAKKSTTKLPFHRGSDSEEELHYGKRPKLLEEYSNVNIELPVSGKTVSLSMDKVKETLNISPEVVLVDTNKSKVPQLKSEIEK